MDLRLELISKETMKTICEEIKDINIDINKIAQSSAITILEKIKKVVTADDDVLDDCEKIDKILCIFEEYNIDTGSCHDYKISAFYLPQGNREKCSERKN
ncbi:MAG: hypothetical protein IJE46_01030 [Clostridia bacterium]|nr:hypothetical protein [Clostridia bacterium]